MKKSWLLIGGAAILLSAAIIIVYSANQPAVTKQNANRSTTQTPAAHDHSHNAAKTMPAFFQAAPNRSSLAPTLEPEKFSGVTREAYRAVKEIPVTIAQLPCYCHCDKGFGHKSLYSCFEDEHASHCAVCVNEALLAFQLEKEGKLTAPQIRDRINETFGHIGN